ncbi:ABC transporter substrate-binding protein [candidate division CSSED10-310 bacterium]|uniref:ABC transporter substrate-binding protein n=1 Tax=candidate division CSSED10-310 bacterium TaxID=2855610 RepID=A0ABV6YRB6_UNCC1
MTKHKGKIFFLVLFLIGLGISYLIRSATEVTSPLSSPSALQSKPSRIICMAPNITETVFALGGGSTVVGVADFTTYPPQAKNLPRVGGYIDPNYEKILVLRPDLIIIQGIHSQLADFCRKKSIRLLAVDMNDLASIYSGMREIGQAIGRGETAQHFVSSIQRDLARIRGRVQGRKRPLIFISLGRKIGTLLGLFTTGNNSFVGELIDLAGGENVFASLQSFYPQISKEALIKRGPDMIIETFAGQTLTPRERNQIIADWDALPMLPAVKNKNIVVVTADFLLIPGPRLVQSAAYLARIFHPECFTATGSKAGSGS